MVANVSIPFLDSNIMVKDLVLTVIDENGKAINSNTIHEGGLIPSGNYKAAEWRSSKETVAKVDDNGRITAMSKGKAIITGKFGGKTVLNKK